jgi:hypothetical protein
MRGLLEQLKRFRLRAFDRSDQLDDRTVENTDALTAARGMQDPMGGSVSVGYPPGYVKEDDGRPRH